MRITVLSQRGQSVLVEYRDRAGALQRAYVPTQTLRNRDDPNSADDALFTVDADELDAGIEYGEPWETMPIGNVGAERIAQELRERGIWTKADVTRNIAQVRAALAAAYAKDLKVLLEAARNGAV